MRIPGGFQTERLVEMLEEQYGGGKLLDIQEDMEQNRLKSAFYAERKTFFRQLTGPEGGGTEMQFRKEWQGRSSPQ